MHTTDLFIEEHRNLSVKEIDLIQWLLAETNNLELMTQIENTKVMSRCSCGCPTIDLKVEGVETRPLGLTLSADGHSPEGVPVGVILHVKDGLLSELEVYSQDETKEFSLPEEGKLHVD